VVAWERDTDLHCNQRNLILGILDREYVIDASEHHSFRTSRKRFRLFIQQCAPDDA